MAFFARWAPSPLAALFSHRRLEALIAACQPDCLAFAPRLERAGFSTTATTGSKGSFCLFARVKGGGRGGQRGPVAGLGCSAATNVAAVSGDWVHVLVCSRSIASAGVSMFVFACLSVGQSVCACAGVRASVCESQPVKFVRTRVGGDFLNGVLSVCGCAYPNTA